MQEQKYFDQGLWIIVDGPDGCGKTTAVDFMVKKMNDMDRPAIKVRALDTGLIGKEIYQRFLNRTNPPNAFMAAYMVHACMMETYYDYILPALQAGISVISDRWFASFFSYQVGGGDAPNLGMLQRPTIAEGFELIKPDLQFILDVSIENAEARMKNRSNGEELTRLDEESIAYKQRVHAAYKKYASRKPGYFQAKELLVVDANREQKDVLFTLGRKLDTVICLHMVKECGDAQKRRRESEAQNATV